MRLLGVRPLDISHDASEMAALIQEILVPYPRLKPWAAVADTARVNPATCALLKVDFFPCMIHVLQLSVAKIITESSLNRLIVRVNETINFFRRSSVATSQLKQSVQHYIDEGRLNKQQIGRKRKLKANNGARWTSTESALARFLLL